MRRAAVRLMALAVAVLGMFTLPAISRASVLAPVPYMGWNTYYGVGGVFDEATVKSVANTLISSGLAHAGYRIVWLDFGWASGARDSTGQLTVDPTQWPDGMAGLTAWLHQQGLEAGIYTDAGRSGCNGEGVGSYGHYQQDANTFAAWGFDAVKMDFCGAGQEGFAPQPLYAAFSQALSNNSSHRALILNVCNFWTPGKIDGTNPTLANSSWGSYVWAPQIAQSWRTDTDIGFTGNIQFQWVLRNLDQDATHPEAAGPGHWNDPDYLGPALGMSDSEAQSQFSMWSMLAAPLMLGSDPRKLSSTEIAMLENVNVIGLDQDALGAQGTLIEQSGSGQVWAKPLANGDVAVALFNRGTSSMSISTTASAVGLPQAGSYTLQDEWANTTTTTTGPITAVVPPQSVTLYRVSPNSPASNTATLRIAMAGADSGTVSANPGPISCPGTCSATYPANTPVTLTATPTGGARFTGWEGGGCTGTGPCTVPMGSATSVTANFAFSQPTLSVSVAGRGTVSDAIGLISCPGACSARYWAGSDATLIPTPAPGSAFSGWSGGGCSGKGDCTLALNGDTAVTANFAPARTLTVAVDGSGAGTISGPGISCPGRCSATYPQGSSVTLTAIPASGSHFGAWRTSGCPEFGAGCTVTLADDSSVWATFDLARMGTAYVLSPRSGTVTPIDLASDTAGPPIGGFGAPHDIAIAPDGGTAYVVSKRDGTVRPIDLATDTTEPRIRGFDSPGPIAISPSGKTAYVLEDDRGLVTIDLATDKREPATRFSSRAGVGQEAASLAISPNGKTAYIGTFTRRAGTSTGTVVAVNLLNYRVKATIRGFSDPAAIALTPDGKRGYVADPARGNVTPIKLSTMRRIAAPQISRPGTFAGVDAIAITPDGKTLYTAGGAHVGMLKTATNAPTPVAVPGIAAARAIAVTPDGRTAYVTSGNGSVIPIDVTTDTSRPELPGLGSPSAIAIAVPPPAHDSVRLATRPRVTWHGISDVIACLSSTMSCTAIQTLTAGPGAVVVGFRTIRIRAHRTARAMVRLNPIGRRLLRTLGSLPVVVSLAIRREGHTDTVMARIVRIRS